MKILILGFTSTVGFRFWEKYNSQYDIVSTYRGSLPNELLDVNANLIQCDDLQGQVEDVILIQKPDIVINTIGMTSPDQCELDKNMSKRVNLDFPIHLIDICKKHHVKLMHFSTHAVYDGCLEIYDECVPFTPINYYGECKSKVDLYIRKNLEKFILLRPTAILSHKRSFQRSNILDFMIQNLINNQVLNLIDTDSVNYTYIEDIIDIIHYLIESNAIGEFNIGGKESMTKFDFGQLVATTLKLNSHINKVSLSELNLPAKRAHKTILNNNKIKKYLNFEFTPLLDVVHQIYKKY